MKPTADKGHGIHLKRWITLQYVHCVSGPRPQSLARRERREAFTAQRTKYALLNTMAHTPHSSCRKAARRDLPSGTYPHKQAYHLDWSIRIGLVVTCDCVVKLIRDAITHTAHGCQPGPRGVTVRRFFFLPWGRLWQLPRSAHLIDPHLHTKEGRRRRL